MQKAIATFFLFLLTGACASAPTTPVMTADMNPNITQAEAELRSQQISDVHYDLDFYLTAGENYTGTSIINFKVNKRKADLRVDFYKGRPGTVRLNGEELNLDYNGHYFMIPAAQLRGGENRLEINFEKDYSQDGRGLYRFKDPEDGRVYLYTDLEPFEANHVFPNFDQPDLKATFKMKVTAPQDWQVITSNLETSKQVNEQNTLTWSFPQSFLFSTYVWSLHAGDYEMWKDDSGPIPLRLFARKSLAKYVDPKEWFLITQQGFAFFNNYFALPYPYKKYDQILVPEYSSGAMENVGAVTFNEDFISRGVKSRNERRNLADTLLHEMAHMWFGNLATMKWWNDLWLNESFASYMAALALGEATEFKEAWSDFNAMKNWAYYEDQLVTTHPIEAPVSDTLQAFASFDGITYGKGASVIKQAAFALGAESFRLGVQNYLKTYANRNTTLKDFISSLSQASERNLEAWQKVWLQTSSLNTIQVEYSCDQGQISDFYLLQTAPEEHPHLRPHSLEIAFLNHEEGRLKVTSSLRTEIQLARTRIPGAFGKACPDVVYPNSNDHGYFKVAFDARSLANLKTQIAQVENPGLRLLLWGSLWDMVRDLQLDYQSFGRMALASLETETDDFVLGRIFNAIFGRREMNGSVLTYYDYQTGAAAKSRASFIKRLEDTLWRRLEMAEPGSENQKEFFGAFIQASENQSALNNIKRLLDGTVRFPGLSIDQDKRWILITRLAKYNFPGVNRLIEIELKKDPSSLGQEAAIRAQASMPNWETKKTWIEEFKKADSKYSLRQLEVALEVLFPRSQKNFREQYAADFYNDLVSLDSSSPAYKAAIFTNLVPYSCNSYPDPRMSQFIEENSQFKPVVRKILRVMKQEAEICGRATAFAAAQKVNVKP